MDKKKIGLFLIGLALLGGLAQIAMLRKGPSDEEQIRGALKESIQASKEGRSGGVLELLSDQFTINEQTLGGSRDIARVVRDMKPDVEVENWAPAVRGDSATLITPVKLSLSGLVPMSVQIPEVRMEFRKEDAMSWLVFPTKKWKLRRVRVSPDSFQRLMSAY